MRRILGSLILCLCFVVVAFYGADHKQKEECITAEKPDVRIEICTWALKELVEQNKIEAAGRKKEERNKWITAAIGTVTTVIPLVVTILEYNNNDCDCPTSQQQTPNNSTG